MFDAVKKNDEFTKTEVIELILQMRDLNQREYAEFVYFRENTKHPEWNLRGAFLAMKEKA